MTAEPKKCPTCGSESYPKRNFVEGAPIIDGKGRAMEPCTDSWHSEMELETARHRAAPFIDFDKTFYLSGPMAGYEGLNFPAFEHAAEVLRNGGLTIVSPHELEYKGDPTKEGLDYLANDFAVMAKECNGIILLRGWPASRGARAELEIALTLKWPVYYYHEFQLIDMNQEGVN